MKGHRSYAFNVRSYENKAWKIQAWTGFKPTNAAIPVRCSYQLGYQANWEPVILWVRIRRWRRCEVMSIKKKLNCGITFLANKRSCSYALNLNSWDNKAWKSDSGFNGIWTRDHVDTGAELLPTELSSQLGAGHFLSSNS